VTPPPAIVDVHWRARLGELQDLLLVAHNVDQVCAVLIKLTNLLSDEWAQREDPLVRQLLREAYEAIDDFRNNRDTGIDLRDWLKTAAPFVRS
jgi:hypothetical protein